MIRKLIALSVSLAVQGAALRAPLVHAHPDDHVTEHHAAHAVHGHVAGHAAPSRPSDHPYLDGEDHDRAIYLQLFFAVTSAQSPPAGTMAMSFDLVAPAETAAHRSMQVAHGLDPPWTLSHAPRAPPAPLV